MKILTEKPELTITRTGEDSFTITAKGFFLPGTGKVVIRKGDNLTVTLPPMIIESAVVKDGVIGG